MPVETVIDLENDITKHINTGDVVDDDMFEAQREFYENGRSFRGVSVPPV